METDIRTVRRWNVSSGCTRAAAANSWPALVVCWLAKAIAVAHDEREWSVEDPPSPTSVR